MLDTKTKSTCNQGKISFHGMENPYFTVVVFTLKKFQIYLPLSYTFSTYKFHEGTTNFTKAPVWAECKSQIM